MLFYDFLKGFCENPVLIFAHLGTAHNFGIKFRAFLGLCAKISTFKKRYVIFSPNKDLGIPYSVTHVNDLLWSVKKSSEGF